MVGEIRWKNGFTFLNITSPVADVVNKVTFYGRLPFRPMFLSYSINIVAICCDDVERRE